MSLSIEEKRRYARHFTLSEVGEEGQLLLKNARVLIVGAGGLGCPSLLYLAGAGVGTLGIIDPDRVDASNLQRQVLYRTEDVGKPKAEVAAEEIRALNPNIKVQAYTFLLDASNALELIQNYDFVLDATDNFSARYLVNDACYFLKKPNIFASVTKFEGRLSVFCTENGPCYRCLFPAPPEDQILNCAAEGILGAVPGVLGTLQALETIKLILNIDEPLKGTLALFDLSTLQLRKMTVSPNPDCPLCGVRARITSLSDVISKCTLAPEITVNELTKLLCNQSEFSLVDVRESKEFESGTIAHAHSIALSRILEGDYQLPKEKPLVLFCKSGQRSQRAAQRLLQKGYTEVFSLSGGILAWHSQ